MRGGDAAGGPDYGAKALLFCGSVGALATGTTNAPITSVTVPATEDWYPTEWDAFATGAGSAAAVVTLLSGVSALQSGKTLTLVANTPVAATFTPGSGEDEGVKVAAGTVLAAQASTGTTTAAANVTVRVWGYRRSPAGFGN